MAYRSKFEGDPIIIGLAEALFGSVPVTKEFARTPEGQALLGFAVKAYGCPVAQGIPNAAGSGVSDGEDNGA
jgi:hypothetical protein